MTNLPIYKIFFMYPEDTDERKCERDADDAFVNEFDDVTLVPDLMVGDKIYVYSILGTITRIEVI